MTSLPRTLLQPTSTSLPEVETLELKKVPPTQPHSPTDGQVPVVAETGRNPPAIQETQVRSLGRDNPLEKGITAHSSILAWRIPWTEEPDGLQSMESQGVAKSQTGLSD